jgi:hypothetical protein
MVRHLVKGRRTPSKTLRETFATLGIPDEAWGDPAEEPMPKKPSPPRAPPPSVRPRTTRRAVDDLRATVVALDEHLGALRNDPLTSPGAVTQALRAKADACDKLAKLQGEGELTMAMIVRSRVWRELIEAFRPVMAKHPTAAAEFAEVLERLEGE